jgi:hypothetical protein
MVWPVMCRAPGEARNSAVSLRPAEREMLVALLDRLLRDVTQQVRAGASPGPP